MALALRHGSSKYCLDFCDTFWNCHVILSVKLRPLRPLRPFPEKIDALLTTKNPITPFSRLTQVFRRNKFQIFSDSTNDLETWKEILITYIDTVLERYGKQGKCIGYSCLEVCTNTKVRPNKWYKVIWGSMFLNTTVLHLWTNWMN